MPRMILLIIEYNSVDLFLRLLLQEKSLHTLTQRENVLCIHDLDITLQLRVADGVASLVFRNDQRARCIVPSFILLYK
jgi:hypothetical protein